MSLLILENISTCQESLHEFGAYSGEPDGENPYGGIVAGPDGTLYGTCYEGGYDSDGAVYKLTPAGGFSLLHAFTDNDTPPNVDGYKPYATVTISGNYLVGTTPSGGLNDTGTVYALPVSNPPAKILWQNSSTGDVYLWNMNFSGGTYSIGSFEHVTTLQDTSWRIAGAGDINHDGVPDLIWQNSNSGDLYDWMMQDDPINGYIHGPGSYYNYIDAVVNTQWQVVGAHDIPGNGVPDLIWQNTASGDAYDWIMTESGGYQMSSYAEITPLVTSNQYQIQAIADINHDNVPDLIWRHTVTGKIYLWYMGYDGTTYSMSTYVTVGTVAPVWKIVGCADINGDGVPDLLFQNQQTGEIVYWLMSYNFSTGAYSLTSYGILTTLAPPWHVVGFGN